MHSRSLVRVQNYSHKVLESRKLRQNNSDFPTFDRAQITDRSSSKQVEHQKSTVQSSVNVINGNMVIRVNASDPASLINSGRVEEEDQNGPQGQCLSPVDDSLQETE